MSRGLSAAVSALHGVPPCFLQHFQGNLGGWGALGAGRCWSRSVTALGGRAPGISSAGGSHFKSAEKGGFGVPGTQGKASGCES